MKGHCYLQPGSDLIAVSVMESGEVMVLDYMMQGYATPQIDENQSVFNIKTDYADGVALAEFSRDLNSQDADDLPLDQCLFFLYPIMGTRSHVYSSFGSMNNRGIHQR